jgi:exonuclease VII large subunit
MMEPHYSISAYKFHAYNEAFIVLTIYKKCYYFSHVMLSHIYSLTSLDPTNTLQRGYTVVKVHISSAEFVVSSFAATTYIKIKVKLNLSLCFF